MAGGRPPWRRPPPAQPGCGWPGECRARDQPREASQVLKEGEFNDPDARGRPADDRGHQRSGQDRASAAGRQPGILQVDVGDDGSVDFDVERADVARIAVKAGNGDDFVRIDESNGIFTDSIPTAIDGGNGDDNLVEAPGRER